ncbi:OLC1v1026119C3 [Oldenlandia corymbosa var. corymbosa]|uniref:OLC1v1026119C3 n=1 Tax=Oldenlandia corymbosa var. corymbosa TaxID=529605 RepID=A0AAV1C6E2_OLDCO|nr:OLC1v1026119C3 [Oldenlandia corymbosa var. corymbosa]
MEVDAGSCLFLEKKSFEGFVTNNDSKKPVENNPNAPVYVNHAANAWHENRKKWTGDLHQKAKRVEKDPIIRLSARGADLQCATNYLAYRL